MIESPLFRFLTVNEQVNPLPPLNLPDDNSLRPSLESIKAHVLALAERVDHYHALDSQSQQATRNDLTTWLDHFESRFDAVLTLAPALGKICTSMSETSCAQNEALIKHLSDLSQSFIRSHSALSQLLTEDRQIIKHSLDQAIQRIVEREDIDRICETILARTEYDRTEEISVRINNVEKACLQLSEDVRSLKAIFEASQSHTQSTSTPLSSKNQVAKPNTRRTSPKPVPIVGKRPRDEDVNTPVRQLRAEFEESGRSEKKKRKIVQSESDESVD